MHTRRWHRVSARIVLATFSTCFVACGGPQGEAQSPTTTVPAVQAPPPTPPPTVPPPPPPTMPAAPPPTLPSQAPATLGKQELRDLVAPVALYPDIVLASLLPATTNGDQIHEAAQYVGNSQQVERVPEDRGWDGSVVGLLQFPDVLRWLDNNPAWTDQMGMAVTYQQADVLNAIQDYRHTVQNVGNLKSNQYQTVQASGDTIRIEPAHPDVVYVPSYDAVAAVQPQPAPEVAASQGINPWLAFGGGAVVGALGAYALYSIFDDDDHGGHTTINHYNNYYNGNGRRPARNNWQARQRPEGFNRRGGDWQRTGRLDYAPQTRPAKGRAPLRPPMTAPGAQPAPTPREVKREQRQERQVQKQERQQQQRQQQRDMREQRQEQKQQRQGEKQRAQQEQRQQRQADKQRNQAERQQRQMDQRQRNQEQRQQNQAERQQRQEQQRQQRQDKQQMQQEQRQQRQEQRQQQHQGQQQDGKKKKKKQ